MNLKVIQMVEMLTCHYIREWKKNKNLWPLEAL